MPFGMYCRRAVYRRAWMGTTDSRHRLPVASNLLDRRFDGWQPNRVWAADITYVATDERWCGYTLLLTNNAALIVQTVIRT